MAWKNIPTKTIDEETDYDFNFMNDIEELANNEEFKGIIEALITASNAQMKMAMQLTKMLVSNNPNQYMTEEKVFAVYTQASKTIAEAYPLKLFYDQPVPK